MPKKNHNELLCFFREMLIKGILPVISSQKQKRGFTFAYKSSTYVFDLIRSVVLLTFGSIRCPIRRSCRIVAARPWAARKH